MTKKRKFQIKVVAVATPANTAVAMPTANSLTGNITHKTTERPNFLPITLASQRLKVNPAHDEVILVVVVDVVG